MVPERLCCWEGRRDKKISHLQNHVVMKTLSTFWNYFMGPEVQMEFEEELSSADR